jgi:hypothetical protein
VVVELNSESRTRRPAARAWAIIRRGQRAPHRTSDRERRAERRRADRTSRTARTSQSHQAQERGMVADGR